MISKLEQYAFICFYTNFITNPSAVERIWKRATECRISPFQTVNLPIFHLFIVHNWHFCLFYIFLRQLSRKSGWWFNNNFCRIKYERWILKKEDGKFRYSICQAFESESAILVGLNYSQNRQEDRINRVRYREHGRFY